jgi:hypothetical protein
LSFRTLIAPALAAGALVAAVPTASAEEVTVCNQAENSHRGGYVLTDGPVDPTPPAFHRGSPMALGEGDGLEHAAEVSPALRECEPEEGGGGEDPV